jgi:hypothetical protein
MTSMKLTLRISANSRVRMRASVLLLSSYRLQAAHKDAHVWSRPGKRGGLFFSVVLLTASVCPHRLNSSDTFRSYRPELRRLPKKVKPSVFFFVTGTDISPKQARLLFLKFALQFYSYVPN